MQDTVSLPGLTGRVYKYWYLPVLKPSAIQSVGGNYMMVKFIGLSCVPIYIGIAENLADRLPNHEMIESAVKLGATHMFAHTNPRAWDRAHEERDLIQRWNPPLNVQHRSDKAIADLVTQVFTRR